MTKDNLTEIRELERTLAYLLCNRVTREQKIKALRNSYWRSHNAGYCDHIAGLQMGGVCNGETETHDLDCKYKYEVQRLLELLEDCPDGGAIAITAVKAEGDHDLGASKFFGVPTVPQEWTDDFCDDEMFFCQIRLSDIAELDTENRLPHRGYLYVFLHTENGQHRLIADVRYYDGEPDVALDDFNSEVEGFESFTQPWLMEFSRTEEDSDCTRLFGCPTDWNYPDPPPPLLMQYDPLDNQMGFLDTLDGFMYLFFGEDPTNFNEVTLKEEYT